MIRKSLVISLVTLTALSTATLVSAQQLSTKRSMNLDVAKAMAAAAEKEAKSNNWQMFITILDDGGTITYLERIDGAQIGSMQVSIDKAESALKFKRPTKAFEDAVKGNVGIVKLPGALPIEGGLPLMVDGQIVGAIGVSGGSSTQDAPVARAGAAVFDAIAKGGK